MTAVFAEVVPKTAVTADEGVVHHNTKGLPYHDADGSGSQADLVLSAKLGAGRVPTFDGMWVI